jgi:ATP-binding protein involved in chromosome partitioning
MKLDRKEILKALETITSWRRKEYGGKRCGYKRSHFGDEVVVDLFCIRRRYIKKRAEDDIKKTIHDLVSPEAKVKVNTSGSGCS